MKLTIRQKKQAQVIPQKESQRLNFIQLLYDPTIPFLNVYPRELKTSTQTNAMYTHVFITGISTILKRGLDTNAHIQNERINDVGGTSQWNTISALKRKTVLIQATMWMNLKTHI